MFLFMSGLLFAQEKEDKYIEKNNLIEATLYSDNGQVSQRGFYNKQGKLQGEWISYDSKGLKTAVAYYNKGEKINTWLFYQNNIINEVTYSNSKISKVKVWKAKEVSIVTN
jgi:antitoxin component YwqK of YwqJK toxin-antitoxin module